MAKRPTASSAKPLNRKSLLERITRHYLESRDFNGLPLRELFKGADPERSFRLLKNLVVDELVAIVFGDGHPNPHIRALPEYHPAAKQVELLKTDRSIGACAYPLPKHLEAVVDRSAYEGMPYALELALGSPQLTHRAFDMMILETYRNDPRYRYGCDDISGSISIADEHHEKGTTKESDQILLQTFGFAYDDERNKYVAVFLWYLFRLSPEHQRIWQAREITKKTLLHPDYFRASILGEWPEHGSIYEAFLEELHVINQMAVIMGRPPFFRNDYSQKERPREFGSLLRPTAREFNAFTHLLDKLMSENISKAFFRDEVADHDEKERVDGRIEIRLRGTIRIFEEWLAQRFRMRDPEPIKEMLETFRKIRKLRQKPAHEINDNTFDQRFVYEQRELMLTAYRAVQTLRLIFANHPSTKSVEVPDWLKEGKIWTQ